MFWGRPVSLHEICLPLTRGVLLLLPQTSCFSALSLCSSSSRFASNESHRSRPGVRQHTRPHDGRWPHALSSREHLNLLLKLKHGLRRTTPVPSSSPTSTVLFWTGDTPHPAAVGGCVVGTWEIAPTSANATLIQEPQPCRLTSLSDGDTIRSLGAPLPHFRSPSCTLYTTLAPC